MLQAGDEEKKRNNECESGEFCPSVNWAQKKSSSRAHMKCLVFSIKISDLWVAWKGFVGITWHE